MIVDGIHPTYPYQLNEKSQYTQHQLTLYRGNYCFKENVNDTKLGGSSSLDSVINVVFM